MRWLILWIALGLGSSVHAAEIYVKLQQLPAAAQTVLQALRGDQPIVRIIERKVGGETVYDVELDRKHAVNRFVRLTPRGEVKFDTWPRPQEKSPPTPKPRSS